MNPTLIANAHAHLALKDRIERRDWKVFVATPFVQRDRAPGRMPKNLDFDYTEVGSKIIVPAMMRAFRNPDLAERKRFALPVYANRSPRGVVHITEHIVRDIMSADVVIADATSHNDGAILELGLALALRSLETTIAITQDDPGQLHFDLKVNNVVAYRQDGGDDSVVRLADVVAACARAGIEEERERLRRLRYFISPQAMYLLNNYGSWAQDRIMTDRVPASESGVDEPWLMRFFAWNRSDYHSVLHELVAAQLMWFHYDVGADHPDRRPFDRFRMHCTPLGRQFIHVNWRGHIQVPQSIDEHFFAVLAVTNAHVNQL